MANFSVSEKNVKFILLGLVVMVLGYILLLGGGSNDPNVFNDAMFNFRRLVLSPIVMVAGIVIVVVAIMKKPKE